MKKKLVVIIAISIFAEYYFGITYKIYLYAEQKNYVLSGIQIGIVIFNTIAVIVLINLGANIQIVKLVSCFIFILKLLIQNLYVKKKYKINLKQAKDDYKIEQKWEWLAQHIALVVHNNTDIVILFGLVWNLGIIGVAIGTLFAMVFRTIEFMYHTSKYLLNRSVFYTFKRLLVIDIEIGIITLIVNTILAIQITSYTNWILQACIVFGISSIVVLLINIIFYYDN